MGYVFRFLTINEIHRCELESNKSSEPSILSHGCPIPSWTASEIYHYLR